MKPVGISWMCCHRVWQTLWFYSKVVISCPVCGDVTTVYQEDNVGN